MTNREFSSRRHSITVDKIKLRLKSNNSEERFNAVHLLIKNDFQESNEILRELIVKDNDTSVRELAIIILTLRNDEELFRYLQRIFNNISEPNQIRSRAIWAIGKLKDEQSYELLVSALNDESDDVVYSAIMGVLDYEYFNSIPLIQQLLIHSKKQLIRQASAWFFGMINNLESRETLEQQMLIDSNPIVRSVCAWSIKQINDINSISSLIKGINQESNDIVRREIVYSLGKILYSQSTGNQDLISFEKTKDLAIRCISRFLIRDQAYIVRRVCAEILGKLNANQTTPLLIEALSFETNQFVRKELIVVLGKIGDVRAMEILEKAKKSHYKIISQAATEALEKIIKNSKKS